MRISDVVTYQDKRWLVTTAKPNRLCVLRTWEGSETEVPLSFDKDETSGLKRVAETSKWPFLSVPMRLKDGPIVRVTIGRNGRTQELAPLTDWVPSNMTRPGGPIFFNPELRLQRGEVLVAAYRSGRMTRLTVNAAFGSVKQRVRRAELANQPPVAPTVYDRLMATEDEFDDDD